MKPLNKFKAANTREQVDCPATSTESKDNPIWEYLMKFCSTENKETLAYVLRFANNTKLESKTGRCHFTGRVERIRTGVIQMDRRSI